MIMEQPQGFVKKGEEHLVCVLKQPLYGVKQAPRASYAKVKQNLMSMLNSKVLKIAFMTLVYMWRLSKEGDYLLLYSYVDAIIVTGDSGRYIFDNKLRLQDMFEMA